jgi:hypothetical protein
MKKNILLLTLLLVVVLIISLSFLKYQEKSEIKNNFIEITPIVGQKEIIEDFYPVAEFRQRITKKSFGDYINPQNSPVLPERFEGFHTGVDVEYEDIKDEVAVFAVCDGEVVLSRWVSGYGGTLILKCQNNYYLYGHLNIDSIVKKTKTLKGEQVAVLGEGKTQETDFERKHLHFSINKKSADLRGYVKDEKELNNWSNPLESDIYRQ